MAWHQTPVKSLQHEVITATSDDPAVQIPTLLNEWKHSNFDMIRIASDILELRNKFLLCKLTLALTIVGCKLDKNLTSVSAVTRTDHHP